MIALLSSVICLMTDTTLSNDSDRGIDFLLFGRRRWLGFFVHFYGL